VTKYPYKEHMRCGMAMRAVAKPGERYATPAAFAAELCLASDPILIGIKAMWIGL
jgi:hypothetical protein